jgi:uncharacterized protein YjiS (DUF1127 family)
MSCGSATCSTIPPDAFSARAFSPPSSPAWPSLESLWAQLRQMGRVHARRRQRLDLFDLNDHQLRDIGLSREQVQREAGKLFWM